MNCHKERKDNKHKLHIVLMILGCIVPIILLLVLLPMLKSSSILIRILPFTLLLICPIIHLIMLPMMFKEGKGEEKQHNVRVVESEK